MRESSRVMSLEVRIVPNLRAVSAYESFDLVGQLTFERHPSAIDQNGYNEDRAPESGRKFNADKIIRAAHHRPELAQEPAARRSTTSTQVWCARLGGVEVDTVLYG